MLGMSHTPNEALDIVARSHSRMLERGADPESALRLVANEYDLRLDVARWAVSQRAVAVTA